MKRLTDKQWGVIEPLIPKKRKFGRPRRCDREVLDGILWVLRTGARWEDLPDGYPPSSTCHDRLQEWRREGIFDKIFEAAVVHLFSKKNGSSRSA